MGLLPELVDAQARARLHWFEDLPAVALRGPFERFGSGYDLFGDGSLLLVALPGHAAGHYGLLFEDDRGPVFLIADASWSSQAIRDFMPPPALVTGWLGDTRAYRDTLAKLKALGEEAPQVRMVPSHCREWRPGRNPTDG
jgi:glyoxylase-like metal-dependent hydrolase (beta-lactamase superfamily II)